MNATKDVEMLENAQVKLTIRIPPEDVQKEYDDIVKESVPPDLLRLLKKIDDRDNDDRDNDDRDNDDRDKT